MYWIENASQREYMLQKEKMQKRLTENCLRSLSFVKKYGAGVYSYPMGNVECLRDCSALCCRKAQNHRIIFDFTEEEVQLFLGKAAVLLPDQGGYRMAGDCVFLVENACALHNTQNQPVCCIDNRAGEALCLAIRRSVAGKRWSEVE